MVTQIIPDMTPLPKRTTNNHARRRLHWANLRTQKWGWSRSCTTDRDRLHSRVRGTAMRWPQGPFPSVAQPAYSSSSGKGAHRSDIQHPHHWGVTSGNSCSGFAPWESQSSVGSATRNLTETDKGRRASSQQQWGLRGQNSCLQSTHRKPNQQPAPLQPSWLAQSGQGTRVHPSLPNLGLQMKSSPSPAAWSAHIQQIWVLAPLPILHGNHSSQSLLQESLFRKTGELSKVGSPSSTQAEVGSCPAHKQGSCLKWALPAPPRQKSGHALPTVECGPCLPPSDGKGWQEHLNTWKLHNPAILEQMGRWVGRTGGP